MNPNSPMPRVTEPELMDEEDQARAYASADFAQAHQSYVQRFTDLFPDCPAQARVLDLGCGPGDVTFRFARAFADWTITAVDGSPAMLAEARRALVQSPDLATRLTLIEGLLPGVPLPSAPYDVVLSTSLLHHLHEPQALWRTVRRGGKPGAIVFMADLFRPETPADASALIDRYAAGEHELLRRDFYHSLLAAFTPDEVRDQLLQAGLGTLQVQTVSDRHLIVWGRLTT